MKIKANRGVIRMAATVVKRRDKLQRAACKRWREITAPPESGAVFRGQLYIIRTREIFSLGRPLP